MSQRLADGLSGDDAPFAASGGGGGGADVFAAGLAPVEDAGGSGGDSAIARAISGDAAALDEVWHAHRRWTAAVLLAHMPRDADLDDLLQDVGMTLVAKIGGVREVGAFKPWLRAVAMSIAKTAGRRRKVRKAGFIKIAGLRGLTEGRGEDDQEDADQPRTAAMHEGRRLMDLSRDLPDGYREPLLLKCVQGMSYREIGRVMNLPETTVETRIARARKMLRERAMQAGVDGTGGGGSGGDGQRSEQTASDGAHRGAIAVGRSA